MWLWVDMHGTLDNDATARHQYQMTGWSLDNGGSIAEPHIFVDRCWVFLCILHCCMAIGLLQVAFVEARLEPLPTTVTRPGRGGVPRATSLEREADVVLQVWEWWFLKVDLPLRTLGSPCVAPCTMATLKTSYSRPELTHRSAQQHKPCPSYPLLDSFLRCTTHTCTAINPNTGLTIKD